jgi:WD40 repeat protein
VRDLDSGKVLWARHDLVSDGTWESMAALAFSPSGTEVAVVVRGVFGGGLVVCDAESGKDLFRQDCPFARAVAFHPTDGTLALAVGNQIERIDYRAKRSLAILKGHGNHVSSLSFSPDGRRLASVAFQETTVRLWDLATGQTVMTLPGRRCVAFSPDGTGLAAAGEYGGSVVVWDIGPHVP